MPSKSSVAGLAISILMLGFMKQSIVSTDVYAEESSKTQILKADGLTKAELRKQFRTLPDSVVIELKGKRSTAGEIREKMQQSAADAEATAKLVSDRQKTTSDRAAAAIETRRVQSLEQRRAKLVNDRAKAMAEFGRERATVKIRDKAK